jgi:uncharacterized membrane protein YgaE (UPF0421/DUF939 family)
LSSILSAPNWLTKSLAIGTDTIPIADVVRSGITVPFIIGSGLALFGKEVAIYAGLAALLIVFAERSGTFGQRMTKATFALFAGTVAMLLGPITSGPGWAALLAVLTFSLISGMLSSFGAAGSFAGMQLLVQMSIAGGLPANLLVFDRGLAYLVGGSVALLGIVVQHAIQMPADGRLGALLRPLHTLEMLLGSTSPGGRAALSQRLSIEILNADDLIRQSFPIGRHQREVTSFYLFILTELSSLAFQILSNRRPKPKHRQMVLELHKQLLFGRHIQSPRREFRVATLWERTKQSLQDRETWHFTLRLMLCMGIAELLRQSDPESHAYWATLTTALVLKPDLASVFSRTLQRGLGTAFGIGFGWLAISLAPGAWMLVPIAILSSLIPFAVRRNYFWFAILITPYVFILLDFVAPTGIVVVEQRLLNTALGCGVVLLFGYLLWPATWFPTGRSQVARICRNLGTLVAPISVVDSEEWSSLRSDIRRQIARLRRREEQAESEPDLFRIRAQRWHQTIVALERLLMTISAMALDLPENERQRVADQMTSISIKIMSRHRLRSFGEPSSSQPLDQAISGLIKSYENAACERI